MTASSLRPVVGIIVPCFNHGRFVSECVQSLHDQTYLNWRAVVLDDASTDGVSSAMCERVASQKVNVVRLPRNLGRSLIRNEGVRQLGYVDYVLNVDCDDYLSSAYIEQLVEALDCNRDVGLAYGQLHLFGQASEGRRWPTQPWQRETMYLENVIPGPGTMIRSAALQQTAGWRSDFTLCSGEDYDIWLQVIEAGWKPIWVKDATYFYRQHQDSFMAHMNQDHYLELQLGILRHHTKHIAGFVGIEAFLKMLILPELLRTLRAGELGKAYHVAKRLLRICPKVAAKEVSKYYCERALAFWHKVCGHSAT